jgi:hypothetical protein
MRSRSSEVVPVVRTVFADFSVEVLFFGLGCQRFWQAVEVNRVGDVAIVPVSVDRQSQFIAI